MSKKILGGRLLWVGMVGALALCSAGVWAAEVALITALAQPVSVKAADGTTRPAQPFTKVRDTDQLSLRSGARLDLVYFKSGRLESWTGEGVIAPAGSEGAVVQGHVQAQTRTLAPILVKQLAKTPSPEEVNRTGMLRLRGMGTSTKVAALEADYASLRAQTPATDRTPEAFLLAGYFELRQLHLLRDRLQQWQAQAPDDVGLAMLAAHFRPVVERIEALDLRVAPSAPSTSQPVVGH